MPKDLAGYAAGVQLKIVGTGAGRSVGIPEARVMATV